MIPDAAAGTPEKCAKTAYKSGNSGASDTGFGERVDECADGAGQARVLRFEAHSGVLKCVGRRDVLNGAGLALRRKCPLDIRQGRLEQRTLLRVELRDVRQLAVQVTQRLLQVVHHLISAEALGDECSSDRCRPGCGKTGRHYVASY